MGMAHSRNVLASLAVACLGLAVLPSAGAVPADQAAQPRSEPTSQELDVRNLPTGDPPAVAWAELRGKRMVLHASDGTTTRVPRRTVAFARMGDGWVIQRATRNRPIVKQIRADGTVRRKWRRTGFGLAVSDRGNAVAFTLRRGRVRVIDSDGDRVLRMPRVPARWVMPARVVGEDCKESETSIGCAVIVNNERKNASWSTSSHGIVDRTPFRHVTTGAGRWTGGITRVRDDGSCSAMRRNLRVRWRTCDNILSVISPDRDHLLGTPAYADGLGPAQLDLLDLRTGDTIHSWVAGARTGVYYEEMWEDREHVLIVTFNGRRKWSIVRLGLDGTMEYAAPPVRTRKWAPYRLTSG